MYFQLVQTSLWSSVRFAQLFARVEGTFPSKCHQELQSLVRYFQLVQTSLWSSVRFAQLFARVEGTFSLSLASVIKGSETSHWSSVRFAQLFACVEGTFSLSLANAIRGSDIYSFEGTFSLKYGQKYNFFLSVDRGCGICLLSLPPISFTFAFTLVSMSNKCS